MKTPWRGLKTIRNLSPSIIVKTIATLGTAAVLLSGSGAVYADQFDDQITALRQQAAAQQDQAAGFHSQADGYRAKVAQLNAQIGALQTQISLSQLKYEKVTADIENAKLKIAKEKQILGDIVKTMYFDSSVSPLEMLASSSNISDFLDNEQYRQSVKSKIQSAMSEIQKLKKDLENQQIQVTQLLADQKSQRQQLATSQAEVNQLLATAQQNAAAADQQVQNSSSEIGKLKAQQAAILAARYIGSGLTGGATCGGGYPGRWCNAEQDTLIDNWGMYNRECVSYTAFKVAVSGRNMPYWGGRGNAKEWPGNAQSSGIPVDGNPRTGDVAISMAGPYGHAMYVEAVVGGKIRVSQYNYGNNGEYSEMSIPSAGLSFIHF